jgi:hypothetical protein
LPNTREVIVTVLDWPISHVPVDGRNTPMSVTPSPSKSIVVRLSPHGQFQSP